MRIKTSFLSALVGLSFGLPAAWAQTRAGGSEFYVLIEGTKQGSFANESVSKSHPNRLVGLNYEHLLKSPRDPASGMATGKRQHGPVTFTKEWGAASPQLFQALVSNEILKSVTFEFYRLNSAGIEELTTQVRLSDAAVTEIHQHSPPPGTANVRQLEDISFTYRAIEIQHLPAKTIAMDEWMASQ
jgi:type VI secretion system secreted protein Hcp